MALDGKRILLVDDNVEITGVTRRFLERRGAQVHVCGDAECALAAVDAAAFDAAIVDNNLPGRMGIAILPELCAKVRKVFMLTGNPGGTLEEDVKVMGAAGLLAKPLGLPELAAILDAALTPPS